MKHEDFMFFETFKDDIDNVRKEYGNDAAEVLALDIIYYGVTGERKSKKEDVNDVHNFLMINIQLHINKSKERLERSIEEAEEKKWRSQRRYRKKTMVCKLE